MKSILLLGLVLVVGGCASLTQKCHEFAKYVDIKAIDCAEEEKPLTVDLEIKK